MLVVTRTTVYLAAILVAGCAIPQYVPPARKQIVMSRAATREEYAPYLASGGASLSGQAFLMTRGGDAKRAAGRQVVLDPLTPYATEWYLQRITIPTAYTAEPGDSLFHAARRTTVADADGRFRFTGLPAGRYRVSTAVLWEAPTKYGLSTQGGVVTAEVTLKDGEAQEVILNQEQ